MSYVTTELGDHVEFDLFGPEGAPGALFIQGAGLARAADPVPTQTARLLADGGSQASVHDRVGRGDSAATGPISLEREIEAVKAIAARMAGPVVLVGHSSGCAIAILAAPHIDNLAGLLLWEHPLDQFPQGAPAWWGRVREQIEAGELEDAVASYMVDMPDEWIEQLRLTPGYPELILSWIPDGTALAVVEEEGPETLLARLTVPVIALVGTETFPGMADAAARIAAAAPRGSAEEVAGAWHAWEPPAMAARIADLLAHATSPAAR